MRVIAFVLLSFLTFSALGQTEIDSVVFHQIAQKLIEMKIAEGKVNHIDNKACIERHYEWLSKTSTSLSAICLDIFYEKDRLFMDIILKIL